MLRKFRQGVHVGIFVFVSTMLQRATKYVCAGVESVLPAELPHVGGVRVRFCLELYSIWALKLQMWNIMFHM